MRYKWRKRRVKRETGVPWLRGNDLGALVLIRGIRGGILGNDRGNDGFFLSFGLRLRLFGVDFGFALRGRLGLRFGGLGALYCLFLRFLALFGRPYVKIRININKKFMSTTN